MSRVKIVATIGPGTNNADSVHALLKCGMDVARLNGSHADLAWHKATIGLLRGLAPSLPILLDIPGRKIRTTQLAHEPSFSIGDMITLTSDQSHDGRLKVPLNRASLHEYLKPGQTVFADDGTLRFTVMKVAGEDIFCRAETDGTLKSAKGINVPSANFADVSMTERDAQMITFAREQGIDFVGVSFVDGAKLVEDVRTLAGPGGPRVLSKVENLQGMNNLHEIVEASDAIMIDRGDLSVETNLESVALLQKQIITAASVHGKPVIVATEMLHSMIDNPFPTKAEVSDITNAVLDGAAALMLSGETAVGRYPAEAVTVMRKVADTAEESVQEAANRNQVLRVPQAMGQAIALLCSLLPITKIVPITISGYAARMVANCRPRQPILAVSNNPATARSMNLLFGTEGIHVDIPFSHTNTDHIAACLRELWRQGRLVDEDVALVTSVGYPKSGNRMNMIQTHLVSDLRESLGWQR